MDDGPHFNELVATRRSLEVYRWFQELGSSDMRARYVGASSSANPRA